MLTGMFNEEKLRFMAKYFEGDKESAYEEKHKIMPKSLFRYEKITAKRLETLEKNQIYMNNSENFNDPFDCKGIWWDKDEFYAFCKNRISTYNKTLKECNKDIEEMLKFSLRPIKITCFSTELHNLPLWGNYADNRRGFCVEYDFKQLSVDSDFNKYLYPVFYETEKINCTFALKQLIDMICSDLNHMHPIIYILYFKNLIKHKSWQYEQEWRLIFTEKAHLIKLPIKPTAIFAGDQCKREDLLKLKEISNKLSCAFYQMEASKSDNRMFVFNEK